MIVYHHTAPGRATTDFRGTFMECMDWMRAAREAGDKINYYIRSGGK